MQRKNGGYQNKLKKEKKTETQTQIIKAARQKEIYQN